MKIQGFSKIGGATALALLAIATLPARAEMDAIAPPLVGTWTLVSADVQHRDGTRTHDYGPAPKGLLFIDSQGHYSLQIFNSERRPFASGDKETATPEEYRAAALGLSTHFGTLSADLLRKALTFHILKASYPNWEGTDQVRIYELKDGTLSYTVPARPNGDVPMSVWRHVN
ncbi:lipocalin-like domain-containing protein [Paraburkholderia agricolaris]|uniref:lipocalin-like domain-containing protein n=1 Tax=Paraburkholderia agricolaris TaxID=2152888 RepID=UPI001290ED76|nr:lipocalin-like domain-containing protein [Paraburkholderia agricolaris]